MENEGGDLRRSESIGIREGNPRTTNASDIEATHDVCLFLQLRKGKTRNPAKQKKTERIEKTK